MRRTSTIKQFEKNLLEIRLVRSEICYSHASSLHCPDYPIDSIASPPVSKHQSLWSGQHRIEDA